MSQTCHKIGQNKIRWHPSGNFFFSLGKDCNTHCIDIRTKTIILTLSTKA